MNYYFLARSSLGKPGPPSSRRQARRDWPTVTRQICGLSHVRSILVLREGSWGCPNSHWYENGIYPKAHYDRGVLFLLPPSSIKIFKVTRSLQPKSLPSERLKPQSHIAFKMHTYLHLMYTMYASWMPTSYLRMYVVATQMTLSERKYIV